MMKNLLVIGGASRNVGKTAFISKIIENFSKKHKIAAVKIKTIYEGDNFFHGKDDFPLSENEKFRITEIFEKNNEGDSGKMLEAGAEKSFKIKTKSEFLGEAFSEMLSFLDDSYLIICESNSLVDFVSPGLYLLIKPNKDGKMKPSAARLEKFADAIIFTDGKKHFFDLENLTIENNSWVLKK